MSDVAITRGRFVEPSVVTSHFHLHEGDVVVDFGSGSGLFLAAFAAAVGERGQVHATEIQRELVEKLKQFIAERGLHNVTPAWCDLEEVGGVPLGDGFADAVTIINTLFALEEKPIALQEARRLLRTGGKLIVIDWSESFGGLGPQPFLVLSEAEATALAETAQFVLERSFDAGDHHYGLAFRKP